MKSLVPLSSVLFLLCSVAHAQCGPDPVPAPAAAHGLTCEIFYDNFTSLSTIDINDTRAPGYKWYVHNMWPGLASGAGNWQTTPVSPSSYFAQDVEGLALRPSVNDPNATYNMMSCATTGVARQYIGTAIRAPLYIDVQITDFTQPGQLPGNHWWVAIWAVGTNFLTAPDPAPGSTIMPEVDFYEGLGGGRVLHQWTMSSLGQIDTHREYSGVFFAPGVTIGTLILPPLLTVGWERRKAM